VRISPSELHVSDPDFIDTLYSRSAPRDKHAYMTRAFGLDGASFATNDHMHHRLRRAAIAPFFSKQRVLGLQDLIRRHVSKLCTRFDEYKVSGRPIPTLEAFSCLTADIIIEYSMGVQQKCLDDPEFAPLYTQAVKKSAMLGVYAKHLPWLFPLVNAIPQSWIANASPEYGAMLAFRQLNADRMREVFSRKDAEKAGHTCSPDTQPTIFDELYSSALPAAEKSLHRLTQESQLIVGAALDTTASALNTTLFHLLSNPATLRTLKSELHTATPHIDAAPELPTLEALPYLTACINEGLRLSHGISARNARLAHTALAYRDWIIPAFTPVGMDAPTTHHSDIFPSSTCFKPERWLSSDGTRADARTADGRPLERFLMAFGRGARMCVGVNLARAEICIALDAIVRRFDFELVECDRRDVDMVHDLTLPGVERGRRGVRVVVR
jgi:cytochrome P450